MLVYRTCTYYNIIAYIERVRGLGPEATAGQRQRCARDMGMRITTRLSIRFALPSVARLFTYITLLSLCCTSIYL